MPKKHWQKLLHAVVETEEYEIDCGECSDLLDQYAELLLNDSNPDRLMPAVKQHLKQCNCCAGELAALMAMLQETTRSTQPTR